MKSCLTMIWLVLLSSVTIMLAATVPPVEAEDRLVQGAMILAPVEGRSMGNISEDTLQACLARIQERVTPEQRMLALQVCHEEEATTKLEPLALKGD